MRKKLQIRQRGGAFPLLPLSIDTRELEMYGNSEENIDMLYNAERERLLSKARCNLFRSGDVFALLTDEEKEIIYTLIAAPEEKRPDSIPFNVIKINEGAKSIQIGYDNKNPKKLPQERLLRDPDIVRFLGVLTKLDAYIMDNKLVEPFLTELDGLRDRLYARVEESNKAYTRNIESKRTLRKIRNSKGFKPDGKPGQLYDLCERKQLSGLGLGLSRFSDTCDQTQKLKCANLYGTGNRCHKKEYLTRKTNGTYINYSMRDEEKYKSIYRD